MARDAPRDRLWILTVAPLVWAAHFGGSYAVASVYCAKVGGALTPVRVTITVLTAVALVALSAVALVAWRRRGPGHLLVDHDADASMDRHRFLATATLLLCGLAGVAVVYQGLTAAIFARCF